MMISNSSHKKLENIVLDKCITTVEEAIEIAEHYSLSWDRSALIGDIYIRYSSKNDLLNNIPEFDIISGWNDAFLADGSSWTTIKGNLLVEFYAYKASTTMYTEPLPKPEKYITNQDVIHFLDRLALEEGIEWRNSDDMSISVHFYNYNFYSVGLNMDGNRYDYLYKDDQIVDNS
jgi:hypothetical protein